METFLCLNSFIFLSVLSKSVLPSLVELKPFECFMWTYSIKLEMLLLCVQSGRNRILIALVYLRKWKIEVDSYFKFKEFNCSFWHLWLIWICRIQWWCPLFSVSNRKYCFWANFVRKIRIVISGWHFVLRLIWISKIQWWCSLPPF